MKRFILSAALSAGMLAPVRAAPAPLPRRTPACRPACRVTPDELAGEWSLRWGGVVARIVLYRDGRYSSRFQRQPWVGAWGIDADGCLCITESFQRRPDAWPAPESFISWRLRLTRSPRGFHGKAHRNQESIEIHLERRH